MGILCIWAVWGFLRPFIHVGKLTAMGCVEKTNEDLMLSRCVGME